ncbi:hypothetical protein BC834DRAFT_874171 [Gloeopeniophorella convolvens]|nr:hypothetical protein BC834DRAFT_874171 [Gloeopeniophorella convolvens]
MLQVHPDSTCDVCLDHYSFDPTRFPDKTPHAIGCGHIFCRECLVQLNHPTSCPLCRKAFAFERIKKLHVDQHIPSESEESNPSAWRLAQRLSECARGDVDIQTTDTLIEETQNWLGSQDHKELFPGVDAALSALVRYKSQQERFHDQQGIINSLNARLRLEVATRDEGRRGALIKELEDELDFYRKHYPGVYELAREHRPQNHDAPYDDRAANGRNHHPGHPLPSPPKPIWYPFTSRNPNYVPPGNSQDPYQRTSIPPLSSQPYVYQTQGKGAVFYEGARYEDRVVPQAVRDMASRDAGREHERPRSRSGHRHRSRDRSRRRDGEGERDRHKRRRDRHRRDTVGGDEAERTAVPGERTLSENALGINMGSAAAGQGIYAPAAPTAPGNGSTRSQEPYASSSRTGGTTSTYTYARPAPAVATTVSVSGSRHREMSGNGGAELSRVPRTDPGLHSTEPAARPSSTPIGPVISSWTAPDLSNPSLNSLGLSAQSREVAHPNLQTFQPPPVRTGPTPRDSVSSWGTADSAPTQGDLFSTLRPLAAAPADSDASATDFSPAEGQLLGVGRTVIASPRPLPARAPGPSTLVDNLVDRDNSESRPRSRHSTRPRSRTTSGSHYPAFDSTHYSAMPTPSSEFRGFPYASVPTPSAPYPYAYQRSATPASRPPSRPAAIPPFPYIAAPQPTVAVSTPSQHTPNPYFYSASTLSLHTQNSSHRSQYQH